jgi:succinoglycan biosynthesis transport protein ExoP
MALEEYWTVVRRWWWLLVLSTLVAAASSYYAVQREPRIYQATTTTMVGQALERANPSSQDLYISQQLAQTYVNMVSRRMILEGAAETLGLSYVPWPDNVSARIVAGTQLLEISVRDTSPQRAQALADAIAEQLILQTPESAEDQSRRAFIEEQLAKLQQGVQDTEAEIVEEQARLDAANSARAIQQYQANIAALQTKLSNYQSTYASLAASFEGGTNYISIVEHAALPAWPISPNVKQTVGVAAAIGLALAVGGAFLIEFLDNTVRTPDELRKATDLPMLGVIARADGNGVERRLIVAEEPRSAIAEAYRALRTNIQFSSVDTPARTLLVTSAGPYEGKSVTIANLAVTIAQSGRSVILVDADLRRPTLHKIFKLANDHGLSSAILANPDDERPALDQLFANGASYVDPSLADGPSSSAGPGTVNRDALGSGAVDRRAGLRAAGLSPLSAYYLQETSIEGLRVMTSGPLPPNPADLLGSERAHALYRALAQQADYVLFDSPPVLAVTDAAILSTRVDGVVLVADAGRTRIPLAGRAVSELARVDARVLGTVLNRVSLRQGGYYAPYSDYQSGDDDERARGPLGTMRDWLSGTVRGRPPARANGSDNDTHPEPEPAAENADDAS